MGHRDCALPSREPAIKFSCDEVAIQLGHVTKIAGRAQGRGFRNATTTLLFLRNINLVSGQRDELSTQKRPIVVLTRNRGYTLRAQYLMEEWDRSIP